MNLWQIEQELLSIFDELENNGGELTEDLENRLYISQEDFNDKIEGYTNYIKSLNNDIDCIKIEQKRLKDLADKKAKTIDRLKQVVIDAIEPFGDTKKSGVKYLDYGTGSVSVRKSESVEVNTDVVDRVCDTLTSIVEFAKQTNQLDVSTQIDKNDIIRITNQSNTDYMSYNHITKDDLDNIYCNIEVTVPIKDLTDGTGYSIIKDIAKYTEDYSIKGKVSKSELKPILKENEAAVPTLAKLVVNKNIIIK